MADEEFVKAQSEFIQEKCHIFEDTEENKLEYTNVQAEYMHIMETAIESQLKTTFGITDEELEEFYDSFKNPSKI